MRYILALDQGTTSSRAILFGHDCNIVGVAQHECRQIFPDAGWVEHDPYDILTSQLTSAVEVLGKAHFRPRDVAALGITNQRETTVLGNRETGRPVCNAIVWQDRRGAPLCQKLADDEAEDTIREKKRDC
jgi:glycerol kinase